MKSLMLGLVFALVAPQAQAREAWDFGAFPYGAKITSQPAAVTDWSCDEDGGCAFSDSQGVRYMTWDGEVVIKRYSVQPGDAHLPLGLSANDDIRSALGKVASRAHVKLECGRNAGNPNIKPAETVCTAKVLGDDPGVWLVLHFGAGDVLQKVELFTEYV